MRFGYPIAGSGVTIQSRELRAPRRRGVRGPEFDHHLSAICLFYVYLRHRSDLTSFLIVGALIVPVAIFSNFIRVMVLVLITYYFGEAAAQGFLHDFAGLTLFLVALLTIIRDGFTVLRAQGQSEGKSMSSELPSDLPQRLSRREVVAGLAMMAAAGTALARKPDIEVNYLGNRKLDQILPNRIGRWKFVSTSGLIVPPKDQLALALYAQTVTRVYDDGKTPIMLLLAYSAKPKRVPAGSPAGILLHGRRICSVRFRHTRNHTRATTEFPGEHAFGDAGRTR